MSIIKCDNCGTLVDTDDEPDAYDARLDRWFCYLCSPDYDSDEPIAVQRYKNWTQGR